jgi:hypothetical protein
MALFTKINHNEKSNRKMFYNPKIIEYFNAKGTNL